MNILIKLIFMVFMWISSPAISQTVAPERVELLKYLHYTPQPESIAVVNVQLDTDWLRTLAPQDEIVFTAPNGIRHVIVHERTSTTQSGTLQWVGHIKNAPLFRTLLTWNTGVFGNIFTPDGEFSINTVNDVTQLHDLSVKPRKKNNHPDDYLVPPVSTDSELHATTPSNQPLFQADAATVSRVDLLAVYTADMAKTYGPDMVRTRIEHLVHLANQAYVDSKIQITLNLVAAIPINYSSSIDIETTLNNLSEGKVTPFVGIQDLRTKYGADLVTLIRPDNSNVDSQTCGLGILNGSNNTQILASAGFSVVNDGGDCTEYTLAHELGHNMGAAHDRANASKADPYFPYAYGYGVNGSFGTIMSYISPVVGLFSNPSILCANSTPCGISESNVGNGANNSLALNNVRTLIADFYPPSTVSDTPSNFSFTTIQGAPANKAVYSDMVKITGISGQVDISIENGEYSVDGAPFTPAPGKLVNGQVVQIRLTSSATPFASKTAHLTVGQITKSFRTFTIGNEESAIPPQISAGYDHSLALRADGTVWAWGGNAKGQLGDGTTVDRPTPTQIPTLSGIKGLSASQTYSLALKSDGTVWGWGDNANDQLSDAVPTVSLIPSKLNLTNIVAISAGSYRALALDNDGVVWAWGYSSRTPMKASLPLPAIAVAAGSNHSVALLSNGSVWTWGSNSSGQLGNPAIGASGNSAQNPTQVPVLESIKTIYSGSNHVIAVSTTGQAWAWGDNRYGQLGNGSVTNSSTPIAINNLAGFSQFYGNGSHHNFAVKPDGTLYAWGSNSSGELGDGTQVNRSVPVPVAIEATPLSLALGQYHSMALMVDGRVKTWGGNWSGQLGQGIPNGPEVLTPAPVSPTDWIIGSFDNYADSFYLPSTATTQAGQTFSTQPVTVAGLKNTAPISILGGSYSINGGAFTNETGTISNGQTVVVKGTAPLTVGQTQPIIVDIGGVSSRIVVQAVSASTTSSSSAAPTTSTVIATTTSTLLSIPLLRGWNLLGNGYTTELDVAAVFGDRGLVTTVWKWLAAKSAWAFYAPSLTSAQLQAYAQNKNYEVLSTISAGEGFWVNAASEWTLTPDVTNIGTLSSDDFRTTGSKPLHQGWSLIATGDNPTPAAFNLTLSTAPPTAGTIPGNVISLWAWDATHNSWQFYAPSLQANNTLETYIQSKQYQSFGTKTLNSTTGFWVNKP